MVMHTKLVHVRFDLDEWKTEIPGLVLSWGTTLGATTSTLCSSLAGLCCDRG